jgi:hypothetical protein
LVEKSFELLRKNNISIGSFSYKTKFQIER